MLRLTVTIIALALPSFAAAQSTCAEKHAAQSCAEGYTWDTQAQTCVQQITS
jgi:hypothetical protein